MSNYFDTTETIATTNTATATDITTETTAINTDTITAGTTETVTDITTGTTAVNTETVTVDIIETITDITTRTTCVNTETVTTGTTETVIDDNTKTSSDIYDLLKLKRLRLWKLKLQTELSEPKRKPKQNKTILCCTIFSIVNDLFPFRVHRFILAFIALYVYILHII